MRPMKLHTGLRIGIVVCILTLALIAAYHYGTARAASVVALPSEITLGNGGAHRDAVHRGPPRYHGKLSAEHDDDQRCGVDHRKHRDREHGRVVGRILTTPTSSVQRHVVTTVWDWNCDSGNWGSGRGSW